MNLALRLRQPYGKGIKRFDGLFWPKSGRMTAASVLHRGAIPMAFCSILGRVAAFVAVLALGQSLPVSSIAAEPSSVQLAAQKMHSVTIEVDVNNGDYVTAKEVKVTIVPATGSDAEGKADLKGPGKVQLPEGAYKVTAELYQIKQDSKLTVGGATTHKVLIIGGFATLKWIHAIGGKAIKDGVKWRLLTYKKNADGSRRLLAELVGSQPRIMLPQGWYIAEGTYKGQTKRLAVEIANSRQYDYVLCASC
jgi:hypothetical protein